MPSNFGISNFMMDVILDLGFDTTCQEFYNRYGWKKKSLNKINKQDKSINIKKTKLRVNRKLGKIMSSDDQKMYYSYRKVQS